MGIHLSVNERYIEELKPIINHLLETLEELELELYLTRNSKLPGQRANLELAYALAEITQNYKGEQIEILWELYESYVKIPHQP